MTYSKSLKFEEQPDYKMLKNLFLDLGKREGLKYDNGYDWKGAKLSKKEEEKKAEDAQLIGGNQKREHNESGQGQPAASLELIFEFRYCLRDLNTSNKKLKKLFCS